MAETFGFYLMTLDVRQESDVHTDAVSEVVGDSVLGLCANYKDLNVAERIELLSKAIETPPPVERIEVSWRAIVTSLSIFNSVVLFSWYLPASLGWFQVMLTFIYEASPYNRAYRGERTIALGSSSGSKQLRKDAKSDCSNHDAAR